MTEENRQRTFHRIDSIRPHFSGGPDLRRWLLAIGVLLSAAMCAQAEYIRIVYLLGASKNRAAQLRALFGRGGPGVPGGPGVGPGPGQNPSAPGQGPGGGG